MPRELYFIFAIVRRQYLSLEPLSKLSLRYTLSHRKLLAPRQTRQPLGARLQHKRTYLDYFALDLRLRIMSIPKRNKYLMVWDCSNRGRVV